MKVTCEITDFSKPTELAIKVHNAPIDGEHVVLEVDGVKYEVDGEELISAVKRCMLNYFKR